MGQANTGSSWNAVGGSSSGGNTVGGSTSGGNTLATGASTSSTDNSGNSSNANSTGASTSSSGGNTLANGSASTIGNTSSASGGNTLGSDASNSGGNSNTIVDASTRYQSKTVFIPAVVPGTPPSQLAIGNVIKETFACGPLQRIIRRPVSGTFIGLISNKSIPQGETDDLAPVLDAQGNPVEYRQSPLPDGHGYRLFGHQVTMFTTVIGVASNRNIAIGGGGAGGEWGQGGMGVSSSNQRLVTSIQLRECEIGTLTNVMVEVAPKPILQ